MRIATVRTLDAELDGALLCESEKRLPNSRRFAGSDLWGSVRVAPEFLSQKFKWSDGVMEYWSNGGMERWIVISPS